MRNLGGETLDNKMQNLYHQVLVYTFAVYAN
jgi:hypothetical protein